MSGFDSEKAKHSGKRDRERPAPDAAGRTPGNPYVAPRVTRVRIETSRMTLGYYDAVQYCTIHDHDVGLDTCTIN